MKPFIKDNFVLIAGITLPIALALVFFLATRLSVMGIEAPQTAVVFATGYYQSGPNLDGYKFDVKDGKIFFAYQKGENHYNQDKPRLFIYEPEKDASREIELPPLDTSKTSSEALESVGNIDTREQSPDGYVFEMEYGHGGSNLMTEIFGGGSHNRGACALRKEGYSHKVPQAQDYNCRFIGWVKE